MRKILIGLGVLVVLVAAVLIIAPRLVPEAVYRDRIETAAEAALGRDVTLAGDLGVSAFPRLSARASDVTVANAPGFSDAPFIAAAELRASLSLFALLARRVEVKEFILVEPALSLEVDRSGANNWTLTADAAGSGPGAAASGSGFERGPGAAPFDAALGDVRLVDGSATYADAATGASYTVSDLDLSLAMPSLNRAMRLSGGFDLDGETFDVALSLGTPRAFFDGDRAPFTAEITSDLVALTVDGAFDESAEVAYSGDLNATIPNVARLAAFFDLDMATVAAVERVTARGRASGGPDGLKLTEARIVASSDVMSFTVSDATASLGDAITYGGRVEFSVPSLRILAETVGSPLPETAGRAFERFSVTGAVNGTPTRAAFTGATITLDAITATGDLAARLDRERPRITGALEANALDFNPYLPPTASGGGGGGGGARPWSDEPIDLSALTMVDADIDIAAGSIAFQNYAIDKGLLSVELNDGVLRVEVTDLAAYGAAGGLEATVDVSGPTPEYFITTALSDLQAQPFLQAAANISRLTGLGDMRITLSASGTSQAAIMSSLTGDGSFSFNDGVLQGVDLTQAAASIGDALDGRFTATAFGPDSLTNFRELTGAFTMIDGVASVDEFTLTAADVAVTAGGALNVADQGLRITLAPTFTGDPDVAGIPSELVGLPVPLFVAGSFTDVSVGLDSEALTAAVAARARSRAEDTAADAIDDAVGGVAGGVLKNVLGLGGRGDADDDAAGSEETADEATSDADAAEDEPSAEDRLRNRLNSLFGDGD